jgi:cytochrome c oxidase subunit 1
MLVTLIYLVVACVRGPRAPANPWESRSFEWRVPSPPPPHNFETTPRWKTGAYDYDAEPEPEPEEGA